MKSPKLLGSSLLAAICLLALFADCSAPVGTAGTPTTALLPSTPTSSAIPQATKTRTLVPVPTRETPTWTPLPTLSSDEALDLVADLLRTNRGCRLPCWWGFNPGETSWDTARHFLESFALKVYASESTAPVRYVSVVIPTPEGLPIYPLHDYTIRDGTIEAIKIDDPGPSPAFGFIEFLRTYGTPSEVWIRTYSEGVRKVPPSFQVALFYPNQGIVAAFNAKAGVEGGKVQGCPQHGLRPWLGLWSPKLQVTFYEASDMFVWDREDWAFLPLEKAAGMDVEAFYRTFSDPNNTSCLETPADLWTPQF